MRPPLVEVHGGKLSCLYIVFPKRKIRRAINIKLLLTPTILGIRKRRRRKHRH